MHSGKQMNAKTEMSVKCRSGSSQHVPHYKYNILISE